MKSREPRPRRLLVALDDDAASTRVAEFVNDFFGGGTYEILAINVAPMPLPYYPDVAYGAVTPFVWPGGFPTSASTEALEVARRDQRAESERVIAATGIDEDATLLRLGDPVVRILEAARNHEVDLIVVGASARGWWGRLLHGSVSDDVVHQARRPVLVVH